MAYTNSPLVSYKSISPNRTSPRSHAIDTITIHCVVGQCSVYALGGIFADPARQASSNYGIGNDGAVGMYVEEKDRSWCSSNAANDNRSITIEVASDTTEPYAVNDKAYAALLDLVTDICKRNGIKALKWSTNKTDRVNHLNGCNMTVHRDYANKSCPGTYLYERMGAIAAEVNKRLNKEGDVLTTMTKEELTTLIDDRITEALQGAGVTVRPSLAKELAEAKDKGITDGTRPGGYARRDEVAAMVLRGLKK